MFDLHWHSTLDTPNLRIYHSKSSPLQVVQRFDQFIHTLQHVGIFANLTIKSNWTDRLLKEEDGIIYRI